MDVHPDPAPSSSSAEIPSLVAAADDGALPRPELEPDASGARQALDAPTDPSETAGTATQVADTDAQDELPCTCWDRQGLKHAQRLGSMKEMWLNLVLPPVKTEIRRAIEATNALIALLQEYHDPQNEEISSLSQVEFRQRILSQRTVVLGALDTATVHITITPGYVCRSTSKKHQARFTEQYKVLCDVEDELQKSIDEAKALFEARDELKKAEDKIRRRKLLQNTVRAASVITVPFSPLASAILTAVDVLVLSFVVGINEVVLPDAAAHVQVTLERIAALQERLESKIAEVKRLRENLEAARALMEEAQRLPHASRLIELMEAVRDAKKAVEAVFVLSCDACACASESTSTSAGPPSESASAPVLTSVREVASAFGRLADMLDAPVIVDGLLGAMDDEQCDVLDRYLADLRHSPGETESPTLV